MAQVKFRSKIAEFSETKNPNAYVGSGATHYFFYRRSSFSTYETIKEENVQGANATSKIVGKGTVTLPIGDGINVEAYHAPKFSSNIISVEWLQKNFEIVFSESISVYPGCLFMKKGTMSIIDEVKLKDDLYPLILSIPNPKSYQANAVKKNNSVDEWHRELGHLSPNRLNKLSEMNSSIPTFDRELIK